MNFFTKLTRTLWSVAEHPLHQSGKVRAAATFSVAQVAARVLPGDVCVPFPNGTQLLVSPRMKGAAHFIFPGLCEFDTMSFALHFLRPEDLFVDAGAYVGAGPVHEASLTVQDVLRWLIILAIVAGSALKFLGAF